jgi:hypothetical protein
VESLLLQVQDNTRLEEARLLLKNNGIPEACHIELIRKLGFDISNISNRQQQEG